MGRLRVAWVALAAVLLALPGRGVPPEWQPSLWFGACEARVSALVACAGTAGLVHLSPLHLALNVAALLLADAMAPSDRRALQFAVAWLGSTVGLVTGAWTWGGLWMGASGWAESALGFAWAAGARGGGQRWVVLAVMVLLAGNGRPSLLTHALCGAVGVLAGRLAAARSDGDQVR